MKYALYWRLSEDTLGNWKLLCGPVSSDHILSSLSFYFDIDKEAEEDDLSGLSDYKIELVET